MHVNINDLPANRVYLKSCFNYTCSCMQLFACYCAHVIYRYIAAKRYNARRKEEVSVYTGDFVHVLNKREGWLKVSLIKTGKQGLIPSEHVIKFKPLDERE